MYNIVEKLKINSKLAEVSGIVCEILEHFENPMANLVQLNIG